MIFEKTFIDGVFKITPEAFEDNRGVLEDIFVKKNLKKTILIMKFINLMFLKILINLLLEVFIIKLENMLKVKHCHV